MPGAPATHVARRFHVSGLRGIPGATLDVHFTLYPGCVKALNEVEARLASIAASCRAGIPEQRDLARRRDVEQGGLTLHEPYFDDLERHVVNHWIPVHDIARSSGATPLLVMDLREHAWPLDDGPAERPHHVAALLENVSSRMVERRASACAAPVRPDAPL